MAGDIKTLELARVYESQGYTQDALEIYAFLDENTPSKEISAGLKRMKNRIQNHGSDRPKGQGESSEKIAPPDMDLTIGADLIDDAVLEQGTGDDDVSEPASGTSKDILVLMDQWLNLMILEDQLGRLKIIKAGD